MRLEAAIFQEAAQAALIALILTQQGWTVKWSHLCPERIWTDASGPTIALLTQRFPGTLQGWQGLPSFDTRLMPRRLEPPAELLPVVIDDSDVDLRFAEVDIW